MPARDPVTSPHLPSTTSPQQSSHHPAVFSPNSSAFSIRDTTSQSQAIHSPPGETGPDPRDSYFSQVLRRLSGSASNGQPGFSGIQQMENSTTSSHDEETSHGSGSLSRSSKKHSAGIDVVDDRYANISLSSSQAIRDASNRLASLSFTSGNRPRRISSASGTSGDNSSSLSHSQFQPSVSPLASRLPSIPDHRPLNPSHLNPAIASGGSPDSFSPPKGIIPPGSVGNVGRSGLSVLMDRERAAKAAAGPATESIKEDPELEEATPRAPPKRLRLDSISSAERAIANKNQRKSSLTEEELNMGGEEGADSDDPNSSSALRRYLASEVAREDLERATESSPLLGGPGGKGGKISRNISQLGQRIKKVTAKDVVEACIAEPIKTLPSVILGLLLNVLDGVSYGMILFPASPVFQDFGSLGVSMFFMSCIVSQLVFSLGGSIFPGGNGSMMIEAVPFFHILVNIIQTEVGDDDKAIIATTMVAFAFSSVLTGLIFFALGAFRLGALIGYFPRHILVGCIGGVGVFLIETGLEVSRGLKEEGFEYNLATLKLFFKDAHAVLLWTIPLVLAILLRVITHFYHHQLVFPAYFFIIPIIFYITVAIGGWNFDHLRQTGWVFDVGKNTQAWWKFYTYFDFGKTSWTAFWAAMPTQLALVFFGILHVPLNVPALGVSLCEDNVKLDRELVAHGVSNLAAGLTGTVPNYLTYVNTVLFYRVGGGSRLSGIMLAVATGAIMMVGPTVIGYLPVMVVGALIFVLGIDLTIEAVWDTRNRVNRMEYITIWAIAIGMTVWDFVIGLLFGIILACIFFVVQNSRRRAIRAVFNGATAKSTVRRPRSQRAFIQQVGSQTYVMKLQGFLFFGTISAVEDEIRKLLDMAKWQHNPIRFLIIDFHLVHGLDFSSAEAFVRVQRLLAAKDVLLILCGAAPNGLVGTALQGVDLWAGREGTRVEVFTGLNEALEWTENAYLTAFYENQQAAETRQAAKIIDFPKVAKPPFSLAESFQNSPRRSHLAKAGGDTLPSTVLPSHREDSETSDTVDTSAQPLPLLLQTFGTYDADEPLEFFQALVPYFTQLVISAGTTLWHQQDLADGLYLIEAGSLRATYSYDNHTRCVQETMVAGTIAGDLSTLSETTRNATVVAERDCVLWKLDGKSLDRMEKEKGDEARRFIRIVLKAVAEEQEVLSSHLIAMLS